MSTAILSNLLFELKTFDNVPQRDFNVALAESVNPAVLLSNQASILSWDNISCGISLGSYLKSSTTPSETASSNLYVWI